MAEKPMTVEFIRCPMVQFFCFCFFKPTPYFLTAIAWD